jgi:hypothetical protein
MHETFKGWTEVASHLRARVSQDDGGLNAGQRASLIALADRLPWHGVLIADEVGMGKTRIAAAVAAATVRAGGRVAVVVPPGLGYQWRDELIRQPGLDAQQVPELLRSLAGFLNAWSGDPAQHAPWGDRPVICLSHAFCNWRLGQANSAAWRWALLPAALALAEQKQRSSGRMPRGVKGSELLDHPLIEAAAQWILARHRADDILGTMPDGVAWGDHSPLFDPENYSRNSAQRTGLLKMVGLGLGRFDLVILDEAHKSRGSDSQLSQLLDTLLQTRKHTRRLALTATPVELDITQWQDMLARIGLDSNAIMPTVQVYQDAVAALRRSPSDPLMITGYQKAARSFEQGLQPWLLRRDKRSDPTVQRFVELSGEHHGAYLQKKEIRIDWSMLDLPWRRAVLAVEALAWTAKGTDAQAQRMRQTLGNGHSIAAMLDHDPEESAAEAEETGGTQRTVRAAPQKAVHGSGAQLDKRQQRVDWWQQVLHGALREPETVQTPGPSGDAALYRHPAILAAVEAIEEVAEGPSPEKVLVFGRYTRPMRALVRLLNARALLRSLERQELWPQSRLSAEDQQALVAALRACGSTKTVENIEQQLAQQYTRLEHARRQFRDEVLPALMDEPALSPAERELLAECLKEEAPDGRALLARALHEWLGGHPTACTKADAATGLKALVQALSDQDPGRDAGDAEEASGPSGWQALLQRLEDLHGAPTATWARLMDGQTRPHTRRVLQEAFNRPRSHLQVLVCQSLVGREGLNLHKACKTVVLLHAEWNPGVVEQQIGRVDRLGSLWQQQLEARQASPASAAAHLPRIAFRPVVFGGTYDEHNWDVLRRRWDDLRAQLHGEVLTAATVGVLGPEQMHRINEMAPDFRPVPSPD